MKKIVIVGGGASGIAAAIFAARRNISVTVLEQASRPLKKLLVTGNGRCNFTNLFWDTDVIRGSNTDRARKIIEGFDELRTIDFFNSLGLQTKCRGSWVYPANDSAAAVAKLMLYECERLKIKLKTNQKVTEVNKIRDGFEVKTTDWSYEADAVIVAAGSNASVADDGYELVYDTAEKHKIKYKQFSPALTALKSDYPRLAKWSGVRAEGKITLINEGKVISEKSGTLQLTEYGISGILVFELGRYEAELVNEGISPTLKIDFAPDNKDFLVKAMLDMKSEKSHKLILLGFLNERLADFILSVSKNEEEIIKNVTGFMLPVTGYMGPDKAQVCMGGIDLNELTDFMESKICPGLYFTGEAVDIDATCGGYNLQWAWSSAYAAANNI